MKAILCFALFVAIIASVLSAGCVKTDPASTEFCKTYFAKVSYKVYDGSFPPATQKNQDDAAKTIYNNLIFSNATETCQANIQGLICSSYMLKCVSYPTKLAFSNCPSRCTDLKTSCAGSYNPIYDLTTFCGASADNCNDGKSSSAAVAKVSFALTALVAMIAMLF